MLNWIFNALSFPYLIFYNFLLETTIKQIEDAFKEFTTREDIAVVLISQYVSWFLYSGSYFIL